MGIFSSIGNVLQKAAPLAAAYSPYIAAGASFLGSQMQNSASAKAAGRQMAFQADMSDTAHQREVADLRAAGLNPILSATGGSGASSPGGSSFAPVNTVENAVSSALQIKRMQADLDLVRSQTRKTNADATVSEKNVPVAVAQAEITSKLINSAKKASGVMLPQKGEKFHDLYSKTYGSNK